MVSVRPKGKVSSLNDAIQELEKIFVDGIRLKAAVSDDQVVVTSEAQDAEEVIAGLRTNITVLVAKLRDTEDTVHRKEIASQKLEESLSCEIRDLQSAVKKKEEALESRDSEVNDLKSKVNVLTEQTTRLELTIQQAKGEAAGAAQDAVRVMVGLKAKIAMLEAQLTLAERPVGETDMTIKGVYQDRDRQIIALNAELKPQTNGTKEISAEALADIQAHDIGALIAAEQVKTSEEKTPTSHIQASGVTSIVVQAGLKTVSQDTFDRMIAEFSELENVIGSIAGLIVRDHVKALGESMKEFPQTRLTELVESLSRQISDAKLKADFRRRFGNV